MADVISRIYSGFRGVDFRGEEVNLMRSPDALNMWKDYKETDSIRTRPGLSLHTAFEEHINGLFFYKGDMLVHSGTSLFKVSGGVKSTLHTGLKDGKSNAFVYDDIWYFKDGQHYLCYDGNTIGPVVGYIPTTTIARKPMGGGTQYEDVNMLSDYRINSFLADGASFSFALDVINIDDDYTPVVKVNGNTVASSEYETNYSEGVITFKYTPPDPPDTDGQDNVTVQFKKAVPRYRAVINECTLLQVFDNRVFFSGNKDFPHMLWHSSLNDPTYCSDTDFYKEGMDDSPIRGLVAGNNALWIFREPSDANTTVFYHTPAEASDALGNYYKIYPSAHSSISTGCVGAAVNFNDDIVFFSDRGMEGISGDITTEQVVAHRSSLVDRRLLTEANYRSMVLAEWAGYLLVCIGHKVYLADSRAMLQHENHLEYEWFYWELEQEVLCASVHDGVLYLGTAEGVYTLTDLAGNVASFWVTPKDKFNYPHRQKTTNKRGCVAEALGDITLYARTEDGAFEKIGSHTGITDYFVSRIKRKKFKDIQFKFASATRFSVETFTMECFIGGYIKR